MEEECFWVNLREDNKVFESKMKVSESKHGRIQEGWYHQVESEWMSEVFFVKLLGTNLGKCEWVWERKTKMAESKMAKIQDDFHHQVKWEWMSLSQIKLVWVRVRMEWECFWVNLREDNKSSESKMAVSEFNMARIEDGCHHQFESEWMSLSQIELVWDRVRVEWRVSLSESERR